MFKVNLAAFYSACGIVPPNVEPTADESGVIEVKDGTDFANLCRRSGVPSGANVSLTFPDVCFVPPPPGGPVPIPYPAAALDSFNSEVRKGGFPKIKIRDAGNASVTRTSSGDEPGTGKGIVSSQHVGKTPYTAYSSDVKYEGAPVIITSPSFR